MNKIKLDEKDAYIIKVSIGKAITYTENQLDNIERLNNLPGVWEDSIKKVENMFKHKPDSTKIGWIKRRTIFLNNNCKKIASILTAGILAIVAVIAMISKYVNVPNITSPNSVLV